MDKAKRSKILIVDDSELNRSLLSDMLCDDFEIIEAENGHEAVAILHERELEISLVLLDIVMPVMDGFEVLSVMNKKGWIKTIPVIMISAESSGSYIDRAYNLGAIDYISRPFDERTVKHRVVSNYLLTIKQKEMSELLSAQMFEKEKDNSLMIEILSHIVEFRNGESGMHVLHVHTLTDMLLRKLMEKTDKYPLTQKEIRLICNASALHDIGKISIPSEVLNKPGRFTPEEFEIMKRHTVEGAKMLQDVPFRSNEELIKYGYQICRWHHERYDGKGYPDGLKGDDIPIAAQVVSVADVYDALTSKRVYKDAYSHDEAIKMILKGECGTFNPLLLECLKELGDKISDELQVVSFGSASDNAIRDTVEQMIKSDAPDVSARSIRLLEYERMKFDYLADISREVVFEYVAMPEMLKLPEWGAKNFGVPLKIYDPSKNPVWTKVFSEKDFADFLAKLNATTPENPVATGRYLFRIGEERKWNKVIAKTIWTDDEKKFEGAIGKFVDVNDEMEAYESLEQKADCDSFTGLLHYIPACKRISTILEESAGTRRYALAVFDLDNFKRANDTYGHLFGNEILKEVAGRIKSNIRSSDIAVRMGGDEFVLFMEYKDSVEPLIKRIFSRLTKPYKDFDVSVSMGIACTEDGMFGFEDLFKRADTAMYAIKHGTKNNYLFYHDGLKEHLEEAGSAREHNEDTHPLPKA